MGLAKGHTARVGEERRQMEALGHRTPKFPHPTINHQTIERQSVVGIHEGKGHNWERFLGEVAFELHLVGCK